jgi:hypothetical protein
MIIKIIKCLCIVFLLCLINIQGFAEPAISPAKPQSLELSSLDVGLKIAQAKEIITADDFYPILINQQDQPYIDVPGLFSQIFDYNVDCTNFNQCSIVSKPADWKMVFSLENHNVTVTHKGETKIYPLGSQMLIQQNGKLWLRYDQFDTFLPNKSRWDVKTSQLNIQTELPVLEILIQRRKATNQKILALQKQREWEAEQNAKVNPITPKSPIDGALMYQLNDNEAISGGNTSSRQAQFMGVADVLQGTLAASGSVNQPKNGPFPYSWNYTLSKPPYFKNLQVGDTNANNTPFLGSYSLTNGISFDKMQAQNAYLQFVYYGQAMPGTEIDVWRNDNYLVGIYYADDSGKFTITDPQAVPGDVYTLKYYYNDGKEQVDTVRFAPDKGNLLKEGDFDTDINYGRLDQGTQFMGHAGESLLRYGVAPGVTVGLGTYWMNFGNDFYNQNLNQLNQQNYVIHYADLAWQAFDSLNLQIDKMLNTSGYALKATSNYFQNNVLEVQYRELGQDSPLLLMPSSLTNSTAYKMLEVKNSFTLGRWRWVNDYWNTNLNQELNSSLNAYFNKWLAPNLVVDFNKPTGSNTAITTQLNNTFMISSNATMQMGWSWAQGGGSSQSAQLTYNGGTQQNYSVGVGLTHSPGSMQPNMNINWRVTKNWNLSLSYVNSGLLFTVGFTDAIALFKSPQLPGQYAAGSVSGIVMSPKIPGQTQYPLEGVKVVVGGNSSITDKHGNYAISGIQTGQTQYLSIDPESLDVSMVPEQDKVPLFFRPGTHIEYNPIIVANIGIDGYVLSSEVIPEDAQIVAIRQDKSGFEVAGAVEDDGFFSLEKLTPGKYLLTLKGVSNPPAGVPLDIPENKTWISNLRIEWQYTAPQLKPAPVKLAVANSAAKPESPVALIKPEQIESLILSNSGIFISPVILSDLEQAHTYSKPAAFLPKKTAPVQLQPKDQLPAENKQIDQMIQSIDVGQQARKVIS